MRAHSGTGPNMVGPLNKHSSMLADARRGAPYTELDSGSARMRYQRSLRSSGNVGAYASTPLPSGGADSARDSRFDQPQVSAHAPACCSQYRSTAARAHTPSRECKQAYALTYT